MKRYVLLLPLLLNIVSSYTMDNVAPSITINGGPFENNFQQKPDLTVPTITIIAFQSDTPIIQNKKKQVSTKSSMNLLTPDYPPKPTKKAAKRDAIRYLTPDNKKAGIKRTQTFDDLNNMMSEAIEDDQLMKKMQN